MDLTLLNDFLELSRELNFSRAAEKRNMTQPAFSRRIKALEKTLQTPLVTRTTRSVQLTLAGKSFEPRAATIVRLMAEARLDALEAAGQGGQGLNIAATHALSYSFVPRWLMAVAGPAQLGTLNMSSDTQRQCSLLIQRGDVNFFICHKGVSELEGLSSRQFISHTIGTDHLVALCATGETGQPLWSLDQKADDVPFIAYAPASGLHTILENHWGNHGRPRLKTVMNSVLAATHLEMAKEGQGVAYLPLSLAGSAIASGVLSRASGENNDIPVDVVICRSRSRLSPHCESFWRAATKVVIS